MTTTDKTLRSSINGKLYKTDIVDGKKQVIEIQDLSFLNKNEEGTYIPRYNIENSRLLLENSEPSEPPTDAEVKDFIKEDQVEFPARTQIRNWVRQELSNRSRNFGLQYTETGEASDYTDFELDTTYVYDSVDLNEHDKKLYKGPKSAWVRVCSNAIVADPNDENNLYKGFILTGNGNFHDTYGFDRGDGMNGGGGEAKTLLGYDLNGKRHEIEEPLYKHRPSPGIVSVETEDVNPGENFRRTTIQFTCWSSAQLDYLDAYFLQVGVSCCVEWGWNTFPRDSLLPLNEEGMPRVGEIFQNQWNPKREGPDRNPPPMSAHVKKGRGNIGCTIGMIHSFSHSIRPDGGYDCTISVSCMSEIMTALNNKASEKLKKLKTDSEKEDEEDVRVTDIRHFMTSTLGRLLINEADGEYNPNNYADTKMSEVNNPDADRKLDKARAYSEYFEQGENARQIQEGTANIGAIGISSTKDAKSNLPNFIKQCNQSKRTSASIYGGHPYKVVAIEGYGGASAFSKDAFVVRPKIYIDKLPKSNTPNITDALLQTWKYKMKQDRSYYSDKDWFSTKIYIKKVSNDGKDLATPIANTKPLLNPKKKENYKALKISRGRWFTFDPYSASKPYYAGKQNAGGTYITVSYLLDIFNIFFGRKSNDDQYKICEFSCWSSRAVAHPNIKSTDGSVLLIPNALAPRRNSNAEKGEFSQSTANMFSGDRNSASYRILKQGENQTGLLGDTTSAFLNMISGEEDNPVTTLDEALKKSPRDDLHRILAVNAEEGMNLQHPSLNNSDENQLRPDNNNTSANVMGGKNEYSTDGAFEEKANTIRPFPDYQYHDTMGSTDGYSGRIGDLFVNMNIIKAEVGRSNNADDMILSIMKQVSAAAGGIWNFKLVGGDTNTSSNHILQLIDANYSGAEPVDQQKRKSWLFKAHTGNSIIRNLSLEVQTTSEVSSQVVFGNPSPNFSPNAKNEKKTGTGMDTKNNYFIRASGDMLLQNVSPSNPPAYDELLKFQTQEGLDPDMASSEKFIVSLKSKGARTEVINTYKQNQVDGNLKTLSNDISWEYAETTENPDPNGDPIPTGKWLPGGPESFADRKDRDAKIREYKNDPYKRNIKTAPNNPYKSIGSGASTVLGNQQKRKTTSFWITKDEIKNIFEKKFKRSRGEITDEFIWKNASSLRGISIAGSKSEFHYPFDFNKKTSKRSKNSPENDAKKMTLDPNITYTIIGFTTSKWSSPKRTIGVTNKRQNAIVNWTGWKDKKWFAIDLDSPHKNDKNLTEYTMTAEEELKDQKSKDIISLRMGQSMLKEGSTLDEAKETMSSYYGTYEKDFEIDVEMVDNDSNRMLNSCRSDVSNPKNNIIFNMPQEGIELNMTLDGIEGFRLYDVFSCTGVPVKYFNTGIFGITGVKHSISANDWTTDITAQFYPDSSNI